MRRLVSSVVLLLLPIPSALGSEPARRPNIVIIVCDDLGYGDVSCCNSGSKIPTPNIDRLASSGMLFTDARAGY